MRARARADDEATRFRSVLRRWQLVRPRLERPVPVPVQAQPRLEQPVPVQAQPRLEQPVPVPAQAPVLPHEPS